MDKNIWEWISNQGVPVVILLVVLVAIAKMLSPLIGVLQEAVKKISETIINSFTSIVDNVPKLNSSLEKIAGSMQQFPERLKNVEEFQEKSSQEHKHILETLVLHGIYFKENSDISKQLKDSVEKINIYLKDNEDSLRILKYDIEKLLKL